MKKFLYSYKELNELRKRKKNIVLAHGVFDLFHIGHLRHLKISKNYGETLVVSLTDDKYINKGPNRPIFNSNNRAEMISSLSFVDYIFINKAETSEKVIENLKPNFYIKGQDYKDSRQDITGNIQKEKKLVEKFRGRMIFTDDITFSSSNLINKFYFKENNVKQFKKYNYHYFEKLFEKTSKLKVAVIGELILDEYCFTNYLGSASKEELVVMNYIDEKLFFGGAYALAKNISDFVKKVDFYSAGNLDNKTFNSLKKDSVENKINVKFFRNNYRIIKKKRFLSQKNHKLFEIYHSSSNEKFNKNDKFRKIISSKISSYDVVIVADFGHGLFSKELISLLQKKSKFLCVNTQTNAENRGFNLITKYKKCNLICLDLGELQLASSKKDEEKKMIAEMLRRVKFKHFILTLSKNGIIVARKESSNLKYFHLGALDSNPLDTMGAGDAVFGISSLLSNVSNDIKINALVSNLFGALKIKILGHEKKISKKELMKSINYMIK